MIQYLEEAARLAMTGWGPMLVLLFMAVESSFIPFPSEVVMIPAGFLAARGEFFPPEGGLLSAALAILCGIVGSLIGAYINYYLALKLGRPALYRYGRYFFLPPHKLARAEEVFRAYGDMTTFLCRLIPVVRQIISIPAGVARMDLARFTFFTAAGAGIWVLILTLAGYWLGSRTEGLGYGELLDRGKALVTGNLHWILLGALVLAGFYFWIHRLAAGPRRTAATAGKGH